MFGFVGRGAASFLLACLKRSLKNSNERRVASFHSGPLWCVARELGLAGRGEGGSVAVQFGVQPAAGENCQRCPEMQKALANKGYLPALSNVSIA
jgi:hypothetical protein